MQILQKAISLYPMHGAVATAGSQNQKEKPHRSWAGGVAFVVYKGAQPMQQAGADGMTYWQFMGERIGAIRELPAKCR
ncbi:MAG: hypothetical protein MUC85_10955 [Anaerolineales bacterium]|jgi:hypothetical protein|nr:hypothetical protein [Anaerolineales bacterium]